MFDTIAAIATGGAISAIGIIRISGSGAIDAAGKVFRAASGASLADAEDRRLYYGRLIDAEGSLIDLCLCTVTRGPGSYTGEDTVEFQCHGSPLVLSEALNALFLLGVRQAQAGEFTKRAFLNGRMDLAQAEAVADLIEADTPAAVRNAAGQLYGVVSVKLASAYDTLIGVMAHFHAIIDYPDDDIEDFEIENYKSALRNVHAELSGMLSTHGRGQLLRNGVPTAIIGRPNTGKSSLLNALVGYDRVIVADTPGTTRDTIEEKLLVGGVLLRLIDTAGLREASEAIEMLGVSRTHDAVNRADLVLLVLDGSEPLCDEDFAALSSIPPDTPTITVVNKSDLPHVLGDSELMRMGKVFCRVSALTGAGLDSLEALVKGVFPDFATPPSGDVITNARQAEAIARALDCLGRAAEAAAVSVTPDALLMDVEAALSAIGEITGSSIRDDIVSGIFERFCVGK